MRKLARVAAFGVFSAAVLLSLSALQVKKAEVRKMIADIDKDDAGLITHDDFVDIMTGRMVR